jgi:hypothetical protein
MARAPTTLHMTPTRTLNSSDEDVKDGDDAAQKAAEEKKS